MILFFFGDDAFRIQEKCLALKNIFFEKNPGSTGFFEFDFSEEIEMKPFIETLNQSGLFATKKFVVAKNVFLAPIEFRRAMAEFLEKNTIDISKDEQRIVLFKEFGQPKKNEKLWKALSVKEIKKEEFLPLSSSQLSKWIEQCVTIFGATGVESKANRLLSTGFLLEKKKEEKTRRIDMFRLEMELKKLGAYRRGKIIREEDVFLLSSLVSEETVFQALDALFSGRRRDASLIFSRLAITGEPLGLLGMCAWQLRNIIRVKGAFLDGRIRSSFEVAKLLGMHPFPAGKCFEIAMRSSFEALESSFSLLTHLTRESKTGDRDPYGALMAFVMGEGKL